jgi:hypothetical protein
VQKFPFQKIKPLRKLFAEGKFLHDLIACEECFGVWVYIPLAFFFKVNFYDVFYFPVISEALTGMTASFLMHLISAGWRSLYNVTVIE